MKRVALAAIAGILLLGQASPSGAAIVSLHTSNVAIDAATFDAVVGVDWIVTTEIWDMTGPGVIEIEMLSFDLGLPFALTRNITIAGGASWLEFASEILDPLGQPNDDAFDLVPQPGFVPAGYTTSNSEDGLFFDLMRGVAPSSDSFDSWTLLTGTQDILTFFNDPAASASGTFQLIYSFRDDRGRFTPGDSLPDNHTLLLFSQAVEVPETSQVFGLALALIGLVFVRREDA